MSIIDEMFKIAKEYELLICTQDLSKFICPPHNATCILYEYFGGCHIKIHAFLRGEELFRCGYEHRGEELKDEFPTNTADLRMFLEDYYT